MKIVAGGRWLVIGGLDKTTSHQPLTTSHGSYTTFTKIMTNV
jgi:hypothetical protein